MGISLYVSLFLPSLLCLLKKKLGWQMSRIPWLRGVGTPVFQDP